MPEDRPIGRRCGWSKHGQTCTNIAEPGKLCCTTHQAELEALMDKTRDPELRT